MRILPQISFELGGFALVGLCLALLMHFSPLPQTLQVALLLIYGITAALWLIGRATFFMKHRGRSNGQTF